MATIFPFLGSTLEVICTTGVRYRGVLYGIDHAEKIITLIKVHHYGSENRQVRDVAGNLLVSTEAKGALPEGMERKIHTAYIVHYQVVADRVEDEQQQQQPEPSKQQAMLQQQFLSTPGPSASDWPAGLHPPVVSDIKEGVINSSSAAANPQQHVSREGDHHSTAPAQPAQRRAAGAVAGSAQEEGCYQVAAKKARIAAPGDTSEITQAEQQSSRECKQLRSQPHPSSEQEVEERSTKEAFDDPTSPLYFITQWQEEKAVGVLLNSHQHPCAPVYMAIKWEFLDRLYSDHNPHHRDNSDLPPRRQQELVRVGDVWRLPYYQWFEGGQTFPFQQLVIINQHYMCGDGGQRSCILTRGLTWMSNNQINQEAKALYYTNEDEGWRAEKGSPSRVARQLHTISMRAKVIEANFERKRAQCYIRVGTSSREKEGDDGGTLSMVRLTWQNYHGHMEDYSRIKEGDSVEVKALQLPAGYWVGPKWLLPNMPLHDDKAPFRPKAREGLREGVVVRSREGDLFPLCILPISFVERASYTSATSSRSSSRAVGSSALFQTLGSSGGGDKLIYFIAQLHPSNAHVIGILMNGDSHPNAPIYAAFPVVAFPSASPPPTLTQMWSVPQAEPAWDKWRTLSSHQYRTGDHPRGELAFTKEHGGTPWLVNELINAQAVATSPSGLQLVRDADRDTVSGRITVLKKTWAEVEAPGCIEGAKVLISMSNLASLGHPLAIGNRVQVERVRLPTKCRVGVRMVLPPNITYHRRKAPFKPTEEGHHVVIKSAKGDYYPVRIMRSTE